MSELAERYAHYAKRLKAYMDARNITGDIGADLIGAHTTTVYDLRRGEQKLDDEWRYRVARAFGIDHDALFGYGPLPKPKPSEIYARKRRGRKPAVANDNIPHYGLAAGSVVGARAMSPDLPERVPCPPGLRAIPDAYALTTIGESMVPRYLPGERLYINPHQAHRAGDHVVIQTANDDGSGVTTWIKRFDAEDEAFVWVTQYNPFGRIKFDTRFVRYIHRVLPVNELF